MTRAGTKSSRSLVGGAKLFAHLKSRMAELGLSVSVWDTEKQCVSEPSPHCDYCRTIQRAGGPCREAAQALADRVIADERPGKAVSTCGCCLIAVPMYQRRRLVGTVVAGFPALDLFDEETMARMCDKLRLDRQVVTDQARHDFRRNSHDVDQLISILRWLLKDKQTLDIADEEIATLSVNLATTYEELSLLYRISGSMRVTQQPHEFMQNICDELLEVMNVASVVAVVHACPHGNEDANVVYAGRIDLDAEQIHRLAIGVITPRFACSNRAMIENHFDGSEAGLPDGVVRNLVAVPLVTDEPIGLLVGFNKISGDFDSADMKLISSIGNQAAVFLTNNRLYADLQDLLMGVLHALTASIDAKDPYTSGHSQRVALISKRLAEECGFAPEKVQEVYLAGLLHDIGKIGVAEATLCKEGRLTDEEYADIKRHPALGSKILGGIRQLDNMIAGILYHHERPDGHGYPQGLKGDEIPVEGLIIGLADAFDAMTSQRTYRETLPLEAVV